MKRDPAALGSFVVHTQLIVFFSLIILTFTSPETAMSNGAAKGRLNGIYEPSGIEQNGSVILIIEDEKDTALHLMTGLNRDLTPDTEPIQRCGSALDDLEGIAADGPYFYLVGSHLSKSDTTRRKKREVFVRLKVTATSCEQSVSTPSLYKGLQAALANATGRHQAPFQINIEALAWKHGSTQLYIGLRQPLINDKSILFILENPQEVFDKGAQPVLSGNPILLPLAGGGIRAMSYIDAMGGYLIANETENSSGKKRSRLWFWNGGTASPIPVKVPIIKKLKNIEGLSAFKHNGQSSVILVCDDGSRKKKKGAHFAIIPTSVLIKSIQH